MHANICGEILVCNFMFWVRGLVCWGLRGLIGRDYYVKLNVLGVPGSVVGIETAYGLDSPGIESRWGEIFRTSPDRP